jgi:hypothetical protein
MKTSIRIQLLIGQSIHSALAYLTLSFQGIITEKGLINTSTLEIAAQFTATLGFYR